MAYNYMIVNICMDFQVAFQDLLA